MKWENTAASFVAGEMSFSTAQQETKAEEDLMVSSGFSRQLVELLNLSEDQQIEATWVVTSVGYKDMPRIRLFLSTVLKGEECRACVDRRLLLCKRLGEISEQQGQGSERGSASVPSGQCWTLPLTAATKFTKWGTRQKWLLYNQGFRE